MPAITKDSMGMLLHRICGFCNAPSLCPVSLIQEVLTYFPPKMGLHISETDIIKGHNGLAGIGGQGIVICCSDTLGIKMALKITKPALNTNFVHGKSGKMNDSMQILEIVNTRFLESAKLQKKIEHFSKQEIRTFVIPRVHIIEEMPVPFFTMDWIESADVLTVLKDKNNILYSLELFMKVLDSAQFLHEYNLVYRDFKHKNIMVTDHEKIVLLDFGLAKEVDNRNVTLSGTPLGTLPYASINMMNGAESANHIDDIHALGFLLWEFITMRECPQYEGVATRIEDREKYRLYISRYLPDALKRIFFDATTSNENRVFPTVYEFQEEIKKTIKLINLKNKRQDYIPTEISPNLKVPERIDARMLSPIPPPPKMKGLTNRFHPANFENYKKEDANEIVNEIEEYKKQIEEHKQYILGLPCKENCDLHNLCKGKGICKFLNLANIRIIEDLLF